MSKLNNRVAHALALSLILPFATGIVHAAEPVKPMNKATETVAEKSVPAPTIDTDKDGKADAWDRDANGLPDAWDVNGDGKPDLFDDNGDGKPDDKKPTLPPAQEVQPEQ
jgi:hypothetical protein